MIKVKICGMKDAVNIKAVAELRPDYMGFICYNKSPRYVGNEFEVNVDVERVGVFVNESVENILRRNFKIVQLHGDESPERCEELKEKDIRVIKVFSIDDDFDFKKTKEYEDVADYFLFDTKGKLYGGNSKTFNWKKLEEYDQKKPFFLSGGLNEENIKNINDLKGMNIHAVDLNSGVEDSPGLKNIEKIKSIMSCLK
jgi:phosphoribosylanthranilate isomerase